MMSPFKLKQCYWQSRQSNNIFWASDFQFGAFVKKKRWFLVVDLAIATIPIWLRSDHVSSESLLSVAGWNTRASFETIKFFSGESLTNNIEMVPVFITTITNMPKRICKNDIPFFNEIFNFIVTVKFVIDEMFNSCLSN